MLTLRFAALVLFLTTPARAALEFSGYLRSKDTLQFVITDLETGAKSEFLSIGGTFQGHRVSAFEMEREVLVLEREGKTFRLPLKDSRIENQRTAPPTRIELKVAIAQDGTPLINEQPVTFEGFQALLSNRAASGIPLTVSFHYPRDPNSYVKVNETIDKLTHAVAQSGVKKWSIKIVSASAPAK